MNYITGPSRIAFIACVLLCCLFASLLVNAEPRTWRVLLVPVDFPDRPGTLDFGKAQTEWVDPMEAMWDDTSYGDLVLETTLVPRVSRLSLPRRFWNTSTDIFPLGTCADNPLQTCRGTCGRNPGPDVQCLPLGVCASSTSSCQRDADCGSAGPCTYNFGFCPNKNTPCRTATDCGGAACSIWNGQCTNAIATSCNSSSDCPGSDPDTCDFYFHPWEFSEPLQSLIDDGLIDRSAEGLTPPGAAAGDVFDTIIYIDAISGDCATCVNRQGDSCKLFGVMYPPQGVIADGGQSYRVGYSSTAWNQGLRCDFDPGDWGELAHEVGHAVALGRAHPAGYISNYELMDSAYPCPPGIYSRASQAVVGEGFPVWFPGWVPDDKILTLNPPVGTTEVIAPTDTDPTATTSPLGLKINVDDGTYYMVECRRNPDPAVLTGCWTDGVLIQRSATPGTNNPNDSDNVLKMQSPPLWPTDSSVQGTWRSHWAPGDAYSDEFYDAANDLTIVTGPVLADGSCTVTVTYGPGATAGVPDVGIIPWLTEPMSAYETVDIWVDSSCNGYEADDPSDTRRLKYGRRADGTVVGNGDDPCLDHENRLYARVRNFGSVLATDIVASFDVTDPLGVGIRGPEGWRLIDSVDKTHPDATCLGTIAAGGFCDVYVEWTPTSADLADAVDVPLVDARFAMHSCVRNRLNGVSGEPAVALANQDGDREQENIAYFEVRQDPATAEYAITEGNIFLFHPEDNFHTGREFVLGIESELPPDWGLEVGEAGKNSYFLREGETVPIPVRITAPTGTPVGQSFSVLVEGFGAEEAVRPDGQHVEIYFAHVGGVLLQARTVIDTQSTLGGFATPPGTCGQAKITASGCLNPAVAGALVTVDFHSPSGTGSRLVETDGAGCFGIEQGANESGTWTVQALWQGDDVHSSAVSPVIAVNRFDPNDTDCDGVPNSTDSCPDTVNLNVDADSDGVDDACDCNPADAGAFAPPSLVTNLLWENPFLLTWDDVAGSAGPGTTYNLLTGSLSSLPLGGGVVPETCLASGFSGNVFQSGGNPAPGEVQWYLLQAINSCGDSPLGPSTSGPRNSSICIDCPHDRCVVGAALDPTCDWCVEDICSLDPYCCDTSWDSTCVEEVRTLCGSLICAESTGQCAHSQCTEGVALTPQCDDPPITVSCVNAICAADSFCCSNGWDNLCVDQVASVCGYNCN
jgi:hypothetical protein